MAIEPFFASRDQQIAQSIYNLGQAFMGPAAQRQRAADEQDALLAQAKIRNLGSDTDYNVARTAGQNFTNDNRAKRYAAAKAKGYDDLTALFYAGSENTNSDSEAGYRESGRLQAGVMERTRAEQAGVMDRTRAEQQGLTYRNDADNAARIRIAQGAPITANPGESVFFAPNDPRNPNFPVPPMTDRERTPGGFIEDSQAVPGLPAPVAPLNIGLGGMDAAAASAAPATVEAPAGLGAAFSAPSARGNPNVVTIPSPAKSSKAEDPIAIENKGLSIAKERTQTLGELVNQLNGRAAGVMGVKPDETPLDPQVAAEIGRMALQKIKDSNYQLDYGAAVDAAMAEKGITFNNNDGGWFGRAYFDPQMGGKPLTIEALRARANGGQAPQVQGAPQGAGATAPQVPGAAPGVSITRNQQGGIDFNGVSFNPGVSVSQQLQHGQPTRLKTADGTQDLGVGYWNAETQKYQTEPIGGGQVGFNDVNKQFDQVYQRGMPSFFPGAAKEEATQAILGRALQIGIVDQATVEQAVKTGQVDKLLAGIEPQIKSLYAQAALQDPRIADYAQGKWDDKGLPDNAMELADRMGIDRKAYGIPDYKGDGRGVRTLGDVYEGFKQNVPGSLFFPGYGATQDAMMAGLKRYFQDVQSGRVRPQ